MEVQGPLFGESTAYRNGKSIVRQTRTYYLKSNKPGNYKFGPATIIDSKGVAHKSNTLEVKIYDSNNEIKNEITNKVFLRNIISKKSAYVGEQIMVDLKLFTLIGINQYNFTQEPNFKNVFYHYMKNFDNSTKVETYKGKRYSTKILKRIILIPSEAGTLNIEPSILEIGITNNKQTGFLNPYQIKKYSLKSSAQSIKVKKLPDTDLAFNGAVGNFSFQAHADKTIISSDQVIDIEFRVEGYGDVKQIIEPSIHCNELFFDISEPEIKMELNEKKKSLGGFKYFKYIFYPKAIGEFDIKSNLVFFNTNRKKYEEIDTTIKVTVKKGQLYLPTKDEKLKTKLLPENDSIKLKLSHLNPNKNEKTSTIQNSIWANSLIWILLFMPVFYCSSIFFIFKNKKRLSSFFKKQPNSYYSLAFEELEKAVELGSNNDRRLFYKSIISTVNQFLADEYQIPNNSFFKKTILKKLEVDETQHHILEKYQKLIKQCEYGLFAEVTVNTSNQYLLNEAKELITLIENSINK